MSDDCKCTVGIEISSVGDARAWIDRFRAMVVARKELGKADYTNWSCAYTWISDYDKAEEKLAQSDEAKWKNEALEHQRAVNAARRCILAKLPPGPRDWLLVDLEETEQ